MEENLHIIEQKHKKKAVLLVTRINEKIIKEQKIISYIKIKIISYIKIKIITLY